MNRQLLANISLPDSRSWWAFECPAVEDMTLNDRQLIVAYVLTTLQLDESDPPEETDHVE